MKCICLATIASAVLLTSAGAASAQDKTQVAHGMKVYADQKCALCHAVDGKGNAKGKLDGVGTRLKAEEIGEWIVNPAAMAAKAKSDRKPPMKAYTNLAKDDVEALVAYMSSLKK